jgi:membrane-bound ClpP family serine protease
MKKNKILTIVAFILTLTGFVFSLIPFYQLWGAFIGGMGLILAIFVLKWIREQNMSENKIKKAVRYGIYALIFGLFVAGGCNLHSYLCYVNPLKKEVEPIKEKINDEIQQTKKSLKKKSKKKSSK